MNNSQPLIHKHPSLKGLKGVYNLFESLCIITQTNEEGVEQVYVLPEYSLRCDPEQKSLKITEDNKNEPWKIIKLTDGTTTFCYEKFGKFGDTLGNFFGFNKKEITFQNSDPKQQLRINYGIEIDLWCGEKLNTSPIETEETEETQETQETQETRAETSYGSDRFLETDPNSILSNSFIQDNNQGVGRLNTTASQHLETKEKTDDTTSDCSPYGKSSIFSLEQEFSLEQDIGVNLDDIKVSFSNDHISNNNSHLRRSNLVPNIINRF
jgi:hypothetical protein